MLLRGFLWEDFCKTISTVLGVDFPGFSSKLSLKAGDAFAGRALPRKT